MSAERFVCPYCGRASSHPQDIANRYCSCCGSPPLLPKDCPHLAVIEEERQRALNEVYAELRRLGRQDRAGT